jgi:hypothetical protein
MRKRDFYHTGLDVSRSELAYIRQPNPSGAEDYYVDGNVSATGSGARDYPFSTLAEAIAASNTSIKLTFNRWWARRNRIFCMGDALDETLTQLPTKCDVIGVGSYDGYTKCGLSGNHSSAAESYGTRFFNMHFLADATASAIFTLAGANSASGVQFHACTFDATLGTVTSGILSTAMPFLGVFDCEFKGPFATSFISFGAGEAGGAHIKDNKMSGSLGKGIITAGTTTASWMPLIQDNIISAAGLVVDDDGDIFYGSGNKMFTAADMGADSLGAMDVTAAKWIDNRLTSSAGTERNANYPFQVQFTS